MLFLLISVVIFGTVFGYCGWRLIGPAQLTDLAAIAAWAALFVLASMTHVYHMVLRDSKLKPGLADLVAWVAYTSLAWVALTFPLLVLRDLGWLLFLGASKLFAHPLTANLDSEKVVFVLQATNLGIVIISTITTGLGMYQARRRPRVVEVTVPIRNLDPALHGFRIVQICDIHVGPTIKEKFVAAVVETVNELQPDLVAVVGDLADGPVEQLRPHVAPLGELRSRHGSFFVTGNHDYYSGVTEWVAEARRLGMDVLLNENRLIEHGDGRLVVAGVTDYTAVKEALPGSLAKHWHDPEAAVSETPADAPRILLAHQPRSLTAALKAGFDLMLCGHTHGGQLIPWNFIVPLQQPFLAGLHEVGDSSWIYVSRGTGYWGPPVRVNAPSEVTCITLVPKI